jgi:hypothetical protein
MKLLINHFVFVDKWCGMPFVRWRVNYNVLYREYNVQIDEYNLCWMKGRESAPLPMHNTTESSDDASFVDSDLGPRTCS